MAKPKPKSKPVVTRKGQKYHAGRNGGLLKSGGTIGPGKPPRLATTIIRDLKEKGVDKVGNSEIEDLIARMQNLTRAELVRLASDEEGTPIIVAAVAFGLVGKKGHEFLVREIWNRQMGTPKQSIEMEGEQKHTMKIVREVITRKV